jgi:hypothetical protein
MNHANSSRNTRVASNQNLLEQQEQIDSLAHSLEQIFDFLEHHKQQGSVDISNLYVAVQDSIKYLTVVVNNLDILKQEIDFIKPGIAGIQDATDKVQHSQLDGLRDINALLESMQKEQSEIQGSILMVKKALIAQQRSKDDRFNWKSLSVMGLGISLITAFTSGFAVNMVTAKSNETNNAIYGRVQNIQDHLGIKNKESSKANKKQS